MQIQYGAIMKLGGSVREPELMVHCIPSFGSQQVNKEMSDFPSQHQCLDLECLTLSAG